MKITFTNNGWDDWVNVYKDGEDTPVLCGVIVDKLELPTWQIWRNIDIPPTEEPIFIRANKSNEEVAARIEEAIMTRPEYSCLF